MSLAVDREGYLRRLEDWTPEVAERLAATESLELTPEHWQVLEVLRAFYRETGVSPSMRPLVKLIRDTLGPDKGTSLHLLTLFPGSPAKVAAKIAGLPRPTNCI